MKTLRRSFVLSMALTLNGLCAFGDEVAETKNAKECVCACDKSQETTVQTSTEAKDVARKDSLPLSVTRPRPRDM